MSVTTKLLTGAAGLAALAGFATPAAAQYYPGYGYPNNNNNVVGAIINSVTGYGRYPYGNYGLQPIWQPVCSQYGNQNMAVDQCARAVEARLNGGNGYYGYGNVPYGGGYNQRLWLQQRQCRWTRPGHHSGRPQELWPEGLWRRQLGLSRIRRLWPRKLRQLWLWRWRGPELQLRSPLRRPDPRHRYQASHGQLARLLIGPHQGIALVGTR